jgi:glycosyltransferase involved in cell wall biosynthesis
MKKVLIITYYWPPSGGSGVQRWLKFSKYLPEFGWEPVIFTPENPDFNLKDETLLSEVDANIEVIKFPIWEPTRMFGSRSSNLQQGQILSAKSQGILGKVATWIRGNFFLPDPKVFWVKPAANFLKEIWRDNDFKAVITTGPPNSIHLVGLRLRNEFGVTWIADFRDPWSRWDLLGEFGTSKLAMAYHRKREKEVLESASRVVTIGHQLAKDLEYLGGRKVDVVHNGYDESDIPSSKLAEGDGVLRMAHIGTITPSRIPVEWIEALKTVLEEDMANLVRIEVSIIGNVDADFVSMVSAHSALSKVIQFIPYVPHHEVFDYIQHSDVLLVFQNRTEDAKAHLPAKMFEYLGMKKPTWIIGSEQSDAAEVIEKTKGGWVSNYWDQMSINQTFGVIQNQFKSQNLPLPTAVEEYTRKNQAKKYAQILSSFVK